MQSTHWTPDTRADHAVSDALSAMGWERVCDEPILLRADGPEPGIDMEAQVLPDGSILLALFEEGDLVAGPIEPDGLPDLEWAMRSLQEEWDREE